MKFLRYIFISFGAMFIAGIGISAFDGFDGKTNLLGSVLVQEGDISCPDDMIIVSDKKKFFCIDKYENSAGSSCMNKNPKNKRETDENIALPSCKSISVEGVFPWRNINRDQAELLCSRSGKRLPKNDEWYKASLGTVDKNEKWSKRDCNVNNVGSGRPDPTGSGKACVSDSGAYDMIGNVWEWVSETVYDGKLKGVILPSEGYVKDISDNGIASKTDKNTFSPEFFNDYFWINKVGVSAIFRGGYWASGSDAGLYAVNITIPASFTGGAVGFRCVKDLD